MYSMLPLSFLVTSLWVSCSLASARSEISPSRLNFGSSKNFLKARDEDRVLRAARLKSDLGPRAINEAIRHDHELHYLDDSLLGKPTQFAAQVQLKARKPTLLLEEIEDDLHEIRCGEDTMKLDFVASEFFELAWREYSEIGEFFVIASHQGCNNDGERDAYFVSKVTRAPDGLLIILAVSKIPWKTALHSMTVDFGETNLEFEMRRHGDLRRRDTPSTSTSKTTSTTDLAHISIPIPTNTPPANSSNYQGTFNSQYGSEISLTLKDPVGLTVKCKKCSTQGAISIIEGSVTFNDSHPPKTKQDFADFIQNGYLKLSANNFSAHIELDSTIQLSKSLTLFSIPAPEIGLPGFQIPGIAVIGPIFRPVFQVGFEASASADFVYGFDMTAPDNSTIIINFSNITQSSINGFQDTSIKAIPLQSKAPSISLTLSTGFSPEILIGISLFNNIGSAAAGVVFNLPAIKATISQVSNVTSTCEPAYNSSSSNSFGDQYIFNSLTHIVPKVDFAVELIAQAEIAPPLFDTHTAYPVWEDSVPLPTACYSYHADEKAYVEPTVGAKSTTGVGGNKGSAATVNPFVSWRFLVFLVGAFSIYQGVFPCLG